MSDSCDPMNRSTPGLPVHHHLPEFTQTHAHWVGDAIQPSHPLSIITVVLGKYEEVAWSLTQTSSVWETSQFPRIGIQRASIVEHIWQRNCEFSLSNLSSDTTRLLTINVTAYHWEVIPLTVSQLTNNGVSSYGSFLTLVLASFSWWGSRRPLPTVYLHLNLWWSQYSTAVLLIFLAFTSIYSLLIFPFIQNRLPLSPALMPPFLL